MLRKVAFCILTLVAPLSVTTARAQDIGTVDIAADMRTTSINISGDPDLRVLAEAAFGVHGQYRVIRDRAAYSATFTSAGPNQVHVEVTSGNPARSVFSQTLSGTNKTNALYRAADAVVRQTSGKPGFFASRLAFIGEQMGKREVFTSDLLFRDVYKITNDRADCVSPRWSPDGSRIIYTSYFGTGFPDIYVIDVASGRRSPFATFKGTNTGARFSPDGSRVAMVLSGPGNPEIFVGSASGGGQRRITNNQSVEASPSWSPDGTRLVFTSDAAGGPRLFQMSATGGPMTRLPMDVSRYSAEPDWNQVNPNLIAFTIAVGGRFTVAVYNMSTRTTQQFAVGPGDAVEPSWLADGRHIICTARGPNTRRPVILDTETGRHFDIPIRGSVLGQVSQFSALPPR